MYNFPVGTSRKDPSFSRILRIIEGFRGYDSIDDLKAADSQVRERLAEQLKKTREEADRARSSLESRMRLSNALEFTDMLSSIEKARIRLSQPPSPKIAACKAYTPQEDIVGKIIRLDFQMLGDAENVYNLMQEFQRMDQDHLIRSNILKIIMAARDITASLDEKDRLVNCMIQV
ncbi:hypothetical protein [Methanocella arvoryzae]|uniref:Uncharacterized protein n=1 Tax=Methanocella arvoryzae (strain DSM 22066 / NBRC 105507 / MRE50) TaxID=351160 RepID=Q0W6D9_METAR|nr:hypothetical protein [Methanocella arvoryzae]CAJ36054.1 hypothetical protein RCIX654 [Methanocella arvoryzae MRE50]